MYAVSPSTAVSQAPRTSTVLSTGRGAVVTGLKKFSRWLSDPTVATQPASRPERSTRGSLADTVIEAVGWYTGSHDQQPATDESASSHSDSH